MRLKRSGQSVGISSLLPHGSRSVAVTCPACPEPGINMGGDWKLQQNAENL